MAISIEQSKEWLRWGYDLGHRYCSDYQNWPPPWPSDTVRDAGPFRDHLELQLIGEVMSRASQGQSHAQIEEWIKSIIDPAPPETGELPPPDLRIRGARGAYLYPGDSNWLFSQRMMNTVQDSDILAWLDTAPQRQSTHVAISVSTGLRPQLGEQPFNPLENDASEQRVRHILELLRRDGRKQVWVYACSQEFVLQNHMTIAQIEDHLTGVAALVKPFACAITPFRELGDVFGGNALEERNRIFRALRQGAPQTPLACHERSLEAVPVQDFRDVEGLTISALQTGFGTQLSGGSYTVGGHTWSGAEDFCRQNKIRMANFVLSGQLEEHVSGVFEHSIPDVGFTNDHRTWAEAQAFGQALLDSGAVSFDMSGAGVLP